MSNPNVPQPPFPPAPRFDLQTGKEVVPTGGFVPLSASKVYAFYKQGKEEGGLPTEKWEEISTEKQAVWLATARLLRDYIRGTP